MTNAIAKAAMSLLLTLALVGCASVSVQDGTEHVTQKMPEIVYVLDFSTAQADFEVDRTGKELTDFKENLQLMLKTAMATDLTNRLVTALPGTKSDWSRHRNAWLVVGQFVTVYQGSRLLRSAIGFGAGGTKIETHVQVYDLAQNSGTPFLTFSTTGGSGAEPGAVVGITGDVLQIAIGGVAGAAHGLTEDTGRTAREITAKFSDYMYHRGWISEDQWIKPKQFHDSNQW